MNSEIENKIDGLVEELKNSLEFLDDKALTRAKIQVLFYLKGYLESSEIDPETVLEDIITGFEELNLKSTGYKQDLILAKLEVLNYLKGTRDIFLVLFYK